MEARAIVKNAPISPRKGRLVADQVRGLPVERAMDILAFSPKKAAALLKKALNSAVSNAENNHGADVDKLAVRRVEIGEGLRLKRMRARARGRGGRIIRRRSHIFIAVGYEEGNG